MIRKLAFAVSAALCLTSGAALAQESHSKVVRQDWNPAAYEGRCQLRVLVDDTARVRVRGDDIWVENSRGDRAYDQGSYCNQPLPFHRVQDFRITTDRGRGRVVEVQDPNRGNNFTGVIEIMDPQDGAGFYVVNLAWRNPANAYAGRPGDDYATRDPLPVFDNLRVCQDRVRVEFLRRNPGDAYLEFTGVPIRDDIGAGRDRVSGDALARNRSLTRYVSYECVVNDRTNLVENISYRYESPTLGSLR